MRNIFRKWICLVLSGTLACSLYSPSFVQKASANENSVISQTNLPLDNLSNSSITVDKIDNYDATNAIRGVDVSSYLSIMDSFELVKEELRQNGASEEEISQIGFKDDSGNVMGKQEFFDYLSSCGVNYVRLRVWNNPYDSNHNGYGGGNNDIEKACELGKYATNAGMNVSIDFHFSDFWADPAKQTAPKEWSDYTLSQKEQAISQFVTDSLNKLVREHGVNVTMVQIGNETNGKFCGESDFSNMNVLFDAGCDAVHNFDSSILAALHFTNPEKSGQLEYYAQELAGYSQNGNSGVSYDVFATSYYPYWHGTMSNLTSVLSSIAKNYNKYVMVAETSWATTFLDGDGHHNTIGDADSLGNYVDYEISPQGQADEIHDVADAVNKVDVTLTNGKKAGLGFFYWEPAWIPVQNVCTATGEYKDNADSIKHSNQTIWEQCGSGWASSASYEYDPEDAGKWYGGSAVDNQSIFDFEGNPLPSAHVFSYLATGFHSTRDANLLSNPSFENGSSAWTLNGTGADFNTEDPKSGSYALHFYDTNDISFSCSNTATVTKPGYYNAHIYIQGKDNAGSCSGESIVLQAVTDDNTTYASDAVTLHDWLHWRKAVVKNIYISQEMIDAGKNTITLSIQASLSKESWGTIDDACLYFAKEESIDIATTSIFLEKDDVIYEGMPCEPKVRVTYNQTTLREGTDYSVTYQNNNSAGTASVIISGKGTYSGTVTKYFTISEKPTESSTELLTETTTSATVSTADNTQSSSQAPSTTWDTPSTADNTQSSSQAPCTTWDTPSTADNTQSSSQAPCTTWDTPSTADNTQSSSQSPCTTWDTPSTADNTQSSSQAPCTTWDTPSTADNTHSSSQAPCTTWDTPSTADNTQSSSQAPCTTWDTPSTADNTQSSSQAPCTTWDTPSTADNTQSSSQAPSTTWDDVSTSESTENSSENASTENSDDNQGEHDYPFPPNASETTTEAPKEELPDNDYPDDNQGEHDYPLPPSMSETTTETPKEELPDNDYPDDNQGKHDYPLPPSMSETTTEASKEELPDNDYPDDNQGEHDYPSSPDDTETTTQASENELPDKDPSDDDYGEHDYPDDNQEEHDYPFSTDDIEITTQASEDKLPDNNSSDDDHREHDYPLPPNASEITTQVFEDELPDNNSSDNDYGEHDYPFSTEDTETTLTTTQSNDVDNSHDNTTDNNKQENNSDNTTSKQTTDDNTSKQTTDSTYPNSVTNFATTQALLNNTNSTSILQNASVILPDKMVLRSVKNQKSKRLSITWKKNLNADGYQLQYATKKSFQSAKTVWIRKNSTNKKVIKKCKKKTYYVKIRAYKYINGVICFGEYSNIKKVRIKK